MGMQRQLPHDVVDDATLYQVLFLKLQDVTRIANVFLFFV